MPGIVGLVTKLPRERAERELRRMVDSLRHESFYVTGTWVDESLGVYAGWAARRGSFSDGMPLANEAGGVHLIFSGEEFPQPGTARSSRNSGRDAKPGPDYLVQEYQENPTFPAQLNGRFHGLLADRARGTALLFNDRYGMHRLYYHETEEAFYFAAETKAILAIRPELRSLDSAGLAEFVACGCVLENRTLFKGIRVLPPASAWLFRNGSLERRGVYFEAREWEEQAPLEPEAYYQQLRATFASNLPRYFNGGQPVGLSLTGGLDTRMILAWHKAPPGTLPCYSFGGMFRESEDVVLARRVAQVCRQPHEVIQVGKEFLSDFPLYAERTVQLTDGCVEVNHSPDLYVNQVARQIAPVRMTGNYGGEVLRRVRLFKPSKPDPGVFSSDLQPQIEAAQATFNRSLQVHPLSFALFRQAPWYHYGLLALEQSQLSLRSPYLDNDFVKTVYRAPEVCWKSNDVCLRMIGEGDAALAQIRTDFGLAGDQGRLSAAATRKFLTFTHKAEYAYDYGMPQRVAQIDHLLSPLRLERLFLGRHKFYHFRVWYRDELSDYVRQMLLDPRTLSRPCFERSGLENIVRGHLKGGRNYTSAIHKVLSLELVHRFFLDRVS